MHLLFGDETNEQPTDEIQFFIYGALVLSADQAVLVHRGMEGIRSNFALAPEEPLKFNDASRPARYSRVDWKEAKAEVLRLLTDAEARFVAYCVHHRIAATRTVQQRNEWALNTVLYGFQKFLAGSDDAGLVVLDQPNLEGRLVLGRLINEGLEIDGRQVRLDRLVGFATAHVEWSHCLSACDVLLGAFRYCVNRPEHEVSTDMFRSVAQLLHHRLGMDAVRHVREHGLFLRPHDVRFPPIAAEYDGLVQNLQRLSDEADRGE